MSTIRVSTAAQLGTAIERARGGDTIELAGGNYGRLSLKDIHFSSDVTLKSASDTNPAIFAYANITKVSHMTFDGVDFLTGAASGGKPFVVNQSDNITIRNATFDGQTKNGGYGDAHGIWVVRSDHFTLENSELRDFAVASYFQDQSDLVVRDNTLTNISWDAMIVGGVHGAVFEDNTIDLHVQKGTKHTDGIQFWNTGTNNPMSDVVVRGNHIETHGTASHGIYAGNGLEATLGARAAFQNVLIEDNVVISAQVSGIAVGLTNGLAIRDNVVLQDAAFRSSSVGRTPVIRVDEDSTRVSITGNTTHANPVASGDNWQPVKGHIPSDWTVARNALVPIGTHLEAVENATAALASADTLRLAGTAASPLRREVQHADESGPADGGHTLPRYLLPDDGQCLGVMPSPFEHPDHFDAQLL